MDEEKTLELNPKPPPKPAATPKPAPAAPRAEPLPFKPETAAEAWLGLLAARGVDYLFANGGTDFAPVVEAYAKGEQSGWKLPKRRSGFSKDNS